MFRKKAFNSINDFNININNLNGMFQVMAANLVAPFASMFAKRLYADDFQIALINSLPAIVSIGAIIPGAIYIQKCRDKRQVTGWFFIGARLFYLLFALVPFMAKQYRASLFVLLYGFMNLPGSISLASWQSYIAGLFPSSMRAGVMASRNKLHMLTGIITTLAAGWLLYNIPKNDDQRVIMYQIFFIAAFALAMVEIYLFFKHREPDAGKPSNDVPSKTLESVSINTIMKGMKSNKRFLYYCLTAMIFHFTWYMMWPLFSLYEIDVLHSNEVWTSLFSCINGAAAAISYPYWSKFVRKKGNALPLSVAAVLMSLVPLAYPMTNSLYVVLVISIAGGISTSGIILIVLNTLYEVSPGKERTIYIAVFNTILAIMLAAAPFVGVAIKNMLNIHAALTIGGLLRVLAGVILYVRYIKEKKHVSPQDIAV